MRYFIYLSYNGTAYSGWQTQPNAPSVQETIERALSTILQQPTAILGAGRTDAGVHAREMVAHIDLPLDLEEARHLIFRADRLLPKDIALSRIVPVVPEAHARFSAVGRTYRYYVSREKMPFAQDLVLRMYFDLDIERMNEAASLLPHFTDFTSFSKLHTDVKTNICHVQEAYWRRDPETGMLVFTITADRFLRNMVRAIVGTLFQVGKGRMSPEDFSRVIEAEDRSLAGSSAPAHALYLERVDYPEELFLPLD
ncbi:tRNA pseudouridine(38-40) synthase TruA [Porphyromonas sp. COT-239 OH1446]|uniref:tRNA pseudouridine(38-40) synthase TruA n=1 Tax=Porphyromonas sp. COT-239 OH1446 TaxID=1515613 RepID=UPI00052DBEA0|nr:tRNA pseudouridine(38-40) synthase TruA [Porphyromonas sp. COT-239 OH1446]KGN68378.1 pseudouridine synthase [Porphyromonas sp. COT-239 OH1446]